MSKIEKLVGMWSEFWTECGRNLGRHLCGCPRYVFEPHSDHSPSSPRPYIPTKSRFFLNFWFFFQNFVFFWILRKYSTFSNLDTVSGSGCLWPSATPRPRDLPLGPESGLHCKGVGMRSDFHFWSFGFFLFFSTILEKMSKSVICFFCHIPTGTSDLACHPHSRGNGQFPLKWGSETCQG